jgi:hypothetical protein
MAARRPPTPTGQGHVGDRDTELLMDNINEVSPEDRRHVAALVESLRTRASP